MTKSLDWKFWVGLLISAIFLYLALREVDLLRVWTLIGSANISFLVLILFIAFFQYVIRAWRWAILLEPIKQTLFTNRLSAILIGFAANCVLPARLGEFIRANLLGTQEDISGSASFGTIVVERLFDGFTLLIILYLGLQWTDFPQEWHSVAGSLRSAGLFLLLAYLVLIVFLMGFKYKAKPFLELLARLLFFLPERFRIRIIDMVWNFSLGLVPLKSLFRWTQTIFYSMLLWFTALLQIFFLEQSVGFTLPLSSTLIVLAMSSFGVMIPSAPGFIGTFHLSVQYSFLFYGIGKEEALSAAIILHAAVFFPTILFGFAAYLLQHISLDKASKGNQLKKG